MRLFMPGKSYQHAEYLALKWIRKQNKKDPDVHYMLWKPKHKTMMDELAPLLRWFWYLIGAVISAILFYLAISYFYKG